MNWSVLAVLGAILVAIVVSNIWLARRAEAEEEQRSDSPK